MQVYEARAFSSRAHQEQRRRYTNEPYIVHCEEVATTIATLHHKVTPTHLDLMMAWAYLHDVVEDTKFTYEDLRRRFGVDVADGVRWLTDCDLETGNRAHRKAVDRERLSRAPILVQAIKCADILSNTPSIVKHDPKFAAVYLNEVHALLMVLGTVNKRPLLWWEAYEAVMKGLEEISDKHAGEVLEVGHDASQL